MSGVHSTLERLLATPSWRDTDASRPLNRARKVLSDLQREKVEVSDLVSTDGDGSEVQWVDMALGGGGINGIATAGYVYALEAAGIRFRGIVGTSAGGIVGTLAAALRDRPDKKCGDALLVKMLDPVEGLKFNRVPDGSSGQKQLSRILQGGLSSQSLLRLLLGLANPANLAYLPALMAIREVLDKGGLHPGTYFKDFLKNVLAEVGVATMAQLKDKCKIVHNSKGSIELMRRDGDKRTPYDGALMDGIVAVVAADVTLGKKATLTWSLPPDVMLNGYKVDDPDEKEMMAELVMRSSAYWAEPDSINPSEFVRCTMAVPGFFYPQKYAVTGTRRPFADDGQVTFVDGGVVSIFPISEFHAPPADVPVAPTFGCEIIRPQGSNSTKTPGGYASALLDTALVAADVAFLESNLDYKKLVAYVIKDNNPLAFDMSQDAKKALMVDGMQAARDFLLGAPADPAHGRLKPVTPFNWKEYKELRKKLAKPFARAPPPAAAPAGRAMPRAGLARSAAAPVLNERAVQRSV